MQRKSVFVIVIYSSTEIGEFNGRQADQLVDSPLPADQGEIQVDGLGRLYRLNSTTGAIIPVN